MPKPVNAFPLSVRSISFDCDWVCRWGQNDAYRFCNLDGKGLEARKDSQGLVWSWPSYCIGFSFSGAMNWAVGEEGSRRPWWNSQSDDFKIPERRFSNQFDTKFVSGWEVATTLHFTRRKAWDICGLHDRNWILKEPKGQGWLGVAPKLFRGT